MPGTCRPNAGDRLRPAPARPAPVVDTVAARRPSRLPPSPLRLRETRATLLGLLDAAAGETAEESPPPAPVTARRVAHVSPGGRRCSAAGGGGGGGDQSAAVEPPGPFRAVSGPEGATLGRHGACDISDTASPSGPPPAASSGSAR